MINKDGLNYCMILGMAKVWGILTSTAWGVSCLANVRTPRHLPPTPIGRHKRTNAHISRHQLALVPQPQQKDMKSATAAIAVPIQISVQRSLLAAEVVVAVGDTATSTSFGTAPAGAFAASVCAPTSIVGAGAVASDFDIWNRIVNGPLDSGRDSIATEPTDAVEFCCSRVSE